MSAQANYLRAASAHPFGLAAVVSGHAYAAGLPVVLAALQRAWARVPATKKVDELEALAHRLSESASTYGFPELGRQAAELGRVVAVGRDVSVQEKQEWSPRVHVRLMALGLAIWEICLRLE